MNSRPFAIRPLYLQLRDVLAERVASGQLKPGTALPNETDLAREFGVSAGTMRKALAVLEAEHLVTRRQGRGTFVNDPASGELANRFCNIRKPNGERASAEFQGEEITEGDANETECERLGLGKGDRVYRVRRLRLDGDQPIMVEDISLPAALFPNLVQEESPTGQIAALAQRHGILLGRAEERISIGTAEPTIARALGLKPGTPLLLLDRVMRSLDARPVEWRIGYCHLGEDYGYVAEMR